MSTRKIDFSKILHRWTPLSKCIQHMLTWLRPLHDNSQYMHIQNCVLRDAVTVTRYYVTFILHRGSSHFSVRIMETYFFKNQQ